MRRTLGTIAAIVTAMSLIGVAWASDGVEAGAEGDLRGHTAVSSSIAAGDGGSVAGSVEESTSRSQDDDATTDTSVAGAKTDTIDDEGSTSTTIDDDGGDDRSITSTTLDEDDGDRDGVVPDLGIQTYAVSGVGSVTIEVVGSGLSLVAVDAPGWTVDVEKDESDRIEIEFRRGEQEAEFDAEIHSNGGLSVEIDAD